jgi:hypothetical protein
VNRSPHSTCRTGKPCRLPTTHGARWSASSPRPRRPSLLWPNVCTSGSSSSPTRLRRRRRRMAHRRGCRRALASEFVPVESVISLCCSAAAESRRQQQAQQPIRRALSVIERFGCVKHARHSLSLVDVGRERARQVRREARQIVGLCQARRRSCSGSSPSRSTVARSAAASRRHSTISSGWPPPNGRPRPPYSCSSHRID